MEVTYSNVSLCICTLHKINSSLYYYSMHGSYSSTIALEDKLELSWSYKKKDKVKDHEIDCQHKFINGV